MEKIKSYLYEGSEVILLDPNDVPGFISLVDDGEIQPYKITAELISYIEEHDIAPMLTYDDSYSGYSDPEEILNTTVQNIENEQRLLYNEWVRESYAEQDEAHRELAVTTDSYCDWTSVRAEFIEICSNRDMTEDEMRKEWKDLCSGYSAPFDGDDITFETVLQQIREV